MKITKNALRQIIQEELNLLNEQGVKVVSIEVHDDTYERMVDDDQVYLSVGILVRVGEQVEEPVHRVALKNRMQKEIVKLGKDPRFHAVIKSTIEDMLK